MFQPEILLNISTVINVLLEYRGTYFSRAQNIAFYIFTLHNFLVIVHERRAILTIATQSFQTHLVSAENATSPHGPVE